MLEEHGDHAGRYVLTTLIDEIHDDDDRIALVIDDWHRVSDPATTAAFALRRARMPPHANHRDQLVTRRTAGEPIANPRRTGRDRLRITMFQRQRGALISERRRWVAAVGQRRDALTASTDGWAAAPQLAALSLRGGGDANSLIGRLSGASDVVGEFQRRTSSTLWNPSCASFCWRRPSPSGPAVGWRRCWPVTRGQVMLEEVERRGLFLQRVDDAPGWYRYHQMFAEFLRARLTHDRPDHLEQLHRIASAWFADHGYLNEAVDHALAYDPIRAVDLVEQDETNLLEQSKMTTLLGIVQKPPQIVACGHGFN